MKHRRTGGLADTTEPRWLRSPTTGARLSLKSGVLFQDMPAAVRRRHAGRGQANAHSSDADYLAASLQWSATTVHESGHWARWHGTTIGVLLTCLAAGFTFTATDMLRTYQWEELKNDFDERFLNLDLLDRRSPGSLDTWRESLGALQLTFEALLDGSSRLTDTLFDPVSIVNIGLSDSWFHLAQLGITEPWPGGHEVRQVEGPVHVVRTRNGEVTTRDLIECAAVIDEGYAFGGLGESVGGEFYEMWALSLVHSRGGRLLHLANELASRIVRPEELLLLIDYSLNPPVPIFDAQHRMVTWEEFYPPSRFAAAARVLSHLNLDALPVTAESVYGAVRLLARATGFRVGKMQARLSRAQRLENVFADDLANHFGVWFYAAHRTHELRDRIPQAVSHFGWAISSGDSTFATELLEDELSGDFRLTDVLKAPFVSIAGSYEVTPPAAMISTQYIVSVAALGAMREVVLGRSVFSLDHVPDHVVSKRNFRQRVDTLMEEVCGRPFRWIEM